MKTAYLSSAYLAPVEYYTKLLAYDKIFIEQHDHYMKQTYRNRCTITGPDGELALSIPTVKPDTPKCPMKDIRISDHGNWRHLHWNAIESAYNNTPFFEYYKDDFRPFYEKKYEFLFAFNMETTEKMIELLDIRPKISITEAYIQSKELKENDEIKDFRDAIRPKKPLPDAEFAPKRYYQVYEQKHGFQPNMSILDLLFNEGNEAIFYL